VRTSNDDLVIYKAFHSPSRSASELWTTNLRWIKLSQQHVPRYTEDVGAEEAEAGFESTLLALDNINGYSTVIQRGSSPAFILKESSSAPRVIGLAGKPIRGLTRFHTSSCQRGFAYLDSTDTLRISQLPPQTHYGHLGWAARRLPMDSEVHAFAYHPSGTYIIGTGQSEEYTLNPEETFHYDLPKEDASFKPHVEQGVVKLIDEKTWTVIDTHVLEPQEVILCIKTLNLEISEFTHQRKDMIAVGTSIIQGEDLATKGNVRIFEVISVVPEPGQPETSKRLKLIAKEELRGAVSTISEIGTQGFAMVAQGQKGVVRGLKEDGTFMPVAFLDMQTYVTTLKSLPKTGMLLVGDAYRGVWFTGLTVRFANPHNMRRRRANLLPGRAIPHAPLRPQQTPSRNPHR
jgi:cleavage and polyadenylation specificity factor subunit 1